MKKIRMLPLILVLAAGLAAVAAAIALWPSHPGRDPGQVQRVYLLEEDFSARLAGALETDGWKEMLDAQLVAASGAGADTLLWSGRAGDAPLWPETGWPWQADPVAYLARQAQKAGLGLVLLWPDGMGENLEKLLARWPLTGACAPAEEGIFQPLTDGLPAIALPEEEGTAFYAAWATGKASAAVALTSGGADYTLLCDQLLGRTPPAVTQLAIAQTLSIGLPQPGQSTYGEVYFAAGTADPALPLTVNGQEVPVLEGGCWGTPVPLEVGENLIEAWQGEQTAQVTITRLAVTEGSWQPSDPQPDGSPELQPGQLVQVTSVLASLLEDAGDSSSILQTVYQGMVGQVTDCIQLQKGSALTHAYKVAGGWLLAQDCQPVEGTAPAVTAISFSQQGRDSVFKLEGASPLAATSRTDTSLTVFFSGATLAAPLPADTGLADGVEAKAEPDGFSLTFTFPAGGLWGWSVDAGEGAATLTLKAPPALSADPLRPLEGVEILLDPGHGGDDLGALGPGGTAGPAEKDLNLAVALAARDRLAALGAQVTLTRQDDSFPTLAQRNQALRQQKPDLFLSIHHNSIALERDVNQVAGVECYYFYPSGRLLAQNLAARVSAAAGRQNRGDKWDYFYVTRSDICPAILLETGFVPNPAEYENCADPAGLAATGFAIAQAVEDTLAGRGPEEAGL